MTYERFLPVALEAIEAARREILPRFMRLTRIDVAFKSDGSPVTEADRAAEQAIRRVFEARTPEAQILGEEYGGERDVSGLQWLIDPIDGTISFSRGIPLFGIIIALLDDGAPVLGVVDIPRLQLTQTGFVGGGAWCDGRRLVASQCTDWEQALIGHSDPYCFDRVGQRAAFESLAKSAKLLRGYTDVFGHTQLISGAMDGYLDVWLNPWDSAATVVLAREAGAKVVELSYPEEKSGLIMGTPALVERLQSFLV